MRNIIAGIKDTLQKDMTIALPFIILKFLMLVARNLVREPKTKSVIYFTFLKFEESTRNNPRLYCILSCALFTVLHFCETRISRETVILQTTRRA